jgi:DNA-binding response OmpR family regulator
MTGARILVVEDEFLLACSLEDDLSAFGYTVIGPVGTLAAAREAVGRETIDAAVLDVNLAGAMVFPLADDLLARRIPIVFLSGYSDGIIPERFRQLPRLPKPNDPVALDRELRKVLAEGA